jgi:hypothetical protein
MMVYAIDHIFEVMSPGGVDPASIHRHDALYESGMGDCSEFVIVLVSFPDRRQIG